MNRSKISSILLDELLEEIKERKEINNLKRKKILSIMLDELLEKVIVTKDFLLNEFNEVEKEEEEDLMEYIITLSYIEDVINYHKGGEIKWKKVEFYQLC